MRWGHLWCNNFWKVSDSLKQRPSISVATPASPCCEELFCKCKVWEKLNRGVSKPGCFPSFLGKVQIVSRTLSGLFLVGALNRSRKRKRNNRENPRTVPEQIGKIPEKSGKSQKGQKRTKKEGQVQIGKPPRLKPPRLAALESLGGEKCLETCRWNGFERGEGG